MWARWNTIGTSQSNIQALIDNNHSNSPRQGFVIQDRPDLPNRPLTFTANPGVVGVSSSFTVGNGNWRNISATNDGTSSLLYIDGVLNGILLEGGLATVQPNISLGYWQGSTPTGRYLLGSIADVYIYDRALSAQEVLQNFNAQKARFGIEQPAPPYTPPFFSGLYKTEYSGYFNDNVSFFATATTTSAGAQQSPINDTSSAARESFSIQWLGYFLPSTTDTYVFSTTSDDASYLWVGPNALSGSFTTVNATVSNGGLHASLEKFGSASLTAGVYYPLRIQYGENGGGNDFSFAISSSTLAKTTNVSGFIFYNSATNGI